MLFHSKMANEQTVITNILSSRSTTEMNTLNNNANKCNQSSNSLKRKRPSKLEIPDVLREICADAKLDCSVKQDDAICFSASGVGVFSLKGKKKFMEDTHKVVSCLQSKKGFFGVYDGHGGNKAAEFVAENLHSNVYEMLKNCSRNEVKEEAVKAGYLKTDQEFLKQGLGSGACCVTALIEENEILVSNIGDCRAVLCRGGTAEALTKDHRAGEDDERRRIEDQGGYVEMHRGAWRIHGILAVSRSIGDAHLKNWVPAEPETKTIRLTPDMEYLVLASDGLWEEVGNQEVVDLVMQSCSRGKIGKAILKENGDEFGCISPLSRSRRVVAVKCKRAGHSPCSMKSVSRLMESEDYFDSENQSPPSKARRISEMDLKRVKDQSPYQENNGFKVPQIPEMDRSVLKVQSPRKGNIDFKGRRVSEVYQMKAKIQSPNKENRDFTTQLISEMDHQVKVKIQSPNEENSELKAKAAYGGLVGACKELVNLAVTRGSLDDITVMIIDLKQFME